MANSHIAVVTGATGFIGSHLVAGLAREGWSVHALVRSSLPEPRSHASLESGCIIEEEEDA